MSRQPVVYRWFFARIFAGMDPERAHRLGFGAIRALGAVPPLARMSRRLLSPTDPALRVAAFGHDLPGPLGLAAGFDKNAVGIDGLAALGFAFVEVGTATALAQPGNPPPRLFRLPADGALVNRMGFNNDGANAIAARLRRRRHRHGRLPVVVGINIGKSKVTPEAEAARDYVASTEQLAPLADYLVVNVSSPNTPGLRNLQAVEQLRPLLVAVREAADRVARRHVPLLVKIAPDLADSDVLAVADLALDLGLDGIIATNTTVSRAGLHTSEVKVAAIGAGGLSGPSLRERSIEVLRLLRGRIGDRLLIISVGGIETADDAWERILAGATLVQAYTAFIYQGPLWPRRIHRGVAERLRGGGYRSLQAAVGAGSDLNRFGNQETA